MRPAKSKWLLIISLVSAIMGLSVPILIVISDSSNEMLLTKAVGMKIDKHIILSHSDRSSYKDYSFVAIVKCDATLLSHIVNTFHNGDTHDIKYALDEAKRVYPNLDIIPELYISKFDRYEVWVLFNSRQTQALIFIW